ncbi:MAG: hypothetical protein J1F01_07595 [Oscillospiraceae bacterium]|nr:hypothetical protein [Oscillospiraceae bacterium]
MLIKQLIALISAVAVMLLGCGQYEISDDAENNSAIIHADSMIADVPHGNNESVYCGYEHLNYTEQEIYNELLEMIQQKKPEFLITDKNTDMIVKAYNTVVDDHPEFFWLNGSYSYQTTTYPDKTETVIKPAEQFNADIIGQMESELQGEVSRIVSTAQKETNDIDKALYVHDYLVDTIEYDNDTYREISSGTGSGMIYVSSTAYGGIISRKAVCSGYSAAFQLIMQRLGIPCGRASGSKAGGGNHEWNYILLDGDFYYIDVTWDDPQMVDSESDNLDNKSYDFFCVTTNELEKTHVIDENNFVPLCTATKYNYYVYNNLYFDTYDFIDVSGVIVSNQNAVINLKFSDENETNKAVHDLIEKKKIFNLVSKTKVKYSIGNSKTTLKMYLE